MSPQSPNHPTALFQAMADVGRAVIEGRRNPSCTSCGKSLDVSVDDFGVTTIVKGSDLAGSPYCDDCDYAAAIKLLLDLPGPDLQPLTDEQIAAMQYDDLVDNGYLIPEPTSEPDGWFHLTPSQLADEYGLSDAELIFQLDTEADGGESL